MAKEKDDRDDAPSLDTQQAALATMISQGITQGIVDAQSKFGPIKQIPITQYKTKSKVNPQGLPENKRPKLTRTYKQNGFGIDADKCSDEERRLLEQLQPGTYCQNLIEVTVRYPEGGGSNIVDIRYNNASMEQRLDIQGRFRNLALLLRELVQERQQLTA